MANKIIYVDLKILPKARESPTSDSGDRNTYAVLQRPQNLDSPSETSPSGPGSQCSGWLYVTLVLGIIALSLLHALIFLSMQGFSCPDNAQNSSKELRVNASMMLAKLKENLCGKEGSRKAEHAPCEYCPVRWVLHERKCYYFSEKKKTWSDSEKYCSSQTSSLAVIDSEEEKNFITTMLTKARGYSWLGLTKENNRWMWVTGDVLLPKMFHMKEVSSSNSTCAVFHVTGIQAEKCFNPNKWVCEKNTMEFPTLFERLQD
ncbi:killer cell lectin-like receptor subfamily G member 1 [Chrysemys picta bellii]|uniref:killer cell lectin-like receptor subfamily G member 1 n=2 Tax=Emydidae TaxID=8476 RepID=UPI0032B2FA2E